MTVKTTCPLGHKCQKYDETGLIEQCAWYITLAGRHPQTGEEIHDSKCAIAWGPIIGLEQANTNRGQTAALESFRNEVVLASIQPRLPIPIK